MGTRGEPERRQVASSRIGRSKRCFINRHRHQRGGGIGRGPGERPWGIGLSPDDEDLFTANGPSGDVSIVDVASRMVKTKIKVGHGPWGLAVVPAP